MSLVNHYSHEQLHFFQSLIPRKLNFSNSSPKIWLQLVKKQYGYNIETEFWILHFVKTARALVLLISIKLVKITFIDFVCLVSKFLNLRKQNVIWQSFYYIIFAKNNGTNFVQRVINSYLSWYLNSDIYILAKHKTP